MKIIINGACGHMGRAVAAAADASGIAVTALVDPCAPAEERYFRNIRDFAGDADVIIDFSHHSATPGLLSYAAERSIPVVLATTGHTPEELEAVKEAAGSVAVFRSANMSLGVALLAGLAKKAAALMPDADVEIVETHHNRKLDAPSGTALMLAEEIKKARDGAFVTCGRSGMSPRKKGEIGISSVRRGNIVGIHEIIFSTGTESITLKHEAHDRALFADGALSAARFLAGKPSGLYGMSDLVAAED